MLKKRLLYLLLTFMVILILPLNCFAYDQLHIVLNGREIPGLSPVIIDGRTMLPLRIFANSLE
jgi:hypothetical protein